MPLRPILKRNLIIRSSQTGTKSDIQEALELCASAKVTPILEITRLESINASLDRVKAGKVEVKNEELGASQEEYGAYRMDSADERQGRQVYEDSTSLG